MSFEEDVNALVAVSKESGVLQERARIITLITEHGGLMRPANAIKLIALIKGEQNE